MRVEVKKNVSSNGEYVAKDKVRIRLAKMANV